MSWGIHLIVIALEFPWVTKEHDDVIKWKHFPRYWPFAQGIHRSPVNSPHKGQWHGALMFSYICTRVNGWVNTRDAGDSRCYRTHYNAIVMRYEHNCKHYTKTKHNKALLSFSKILQIRIYFETQTITSTVYWCIASKLKAPRNFYWMSNMFLWVEIFLSFVCYHVVPKRHSQLDYELDGLWNKMKLKTTRWRW